MTDSETIIDFTMTNWITVLGMVILGSIVLGLGISLWTKIKSRGTANG